MKSRLLAFLLVIILVLSLAPLASAQDTVMCFNLSADDCAILQAADAKSAEMTSFRIDYTFNLDANVSSLAAMGLSEGAGPGTIKITSSGGGPFMLDMAKLVEDPTQAIALAMDLVAAFSDGTTDESANVSFVIVDGVFYMKNPEGEEWVGFSLADAMAMSGLPIDPMSLMGSGAGTDPTALLGAAGMGMGDMEALANIPGFINQERLADEAMMGQTMYPFRTTIDLAALFAAPEFQTMLNQAMSAAGGASGDSSMAMMGAMIPMLLSNSTLTISTTQWIGADDLFTHRFTLDVNASVDLNALMSAAGGTSDAPKLDPITVVLNLAVDLSEINSSFDISAPAGATMMPMEG